MDMLNKLKKDIDLGIREFWRDLKPISAAKKASPELWSAMRDFVSRDGKRIRPSLFVIAYLGYKKTVPLSYKKIVRASLSLEFLHAFLLIHDDVIDRSSLRRGQPTLHKVLNARYKMRGDNPLGPNLSIVAGDILFSLAFHALLSLGDKTGNLRDCLEEFISSVIDTGTGEYIDVVNNIKDIDKLREIDILNTYILKTARYTFESPLKMGAILADAPEKEIKKLSALGRMLGESFQIQDDLLDIFSTSKITGKPVLSDLAESKKTLLVWRAYRTLKTGDRNFLKTALNKDKKTRKDIYRLKELIERSGAAYYCLERSNALIRRSEKILSGLKINEPCKKALKEMVTSLRHKSSYLEERLKSHA